MGIVQAGLTIAAMLSPEANPVTKGGKFAYVGPGWNGTLPPDVKRINAPTPWILIQPRVHLPNQSGLERARKVLARSPYKPFQPTWSKPARCPRPSSVSAPDLVNPKLPVSALDLKDPLQFWEILSAVINENPPPKDEITALLPMFKPLGLEVGKQWDRSKLDPVTLNSMSRAAAEIPQFRQIALERQADQRLVHNAA